MHEADKSNSCGLKDSSATPYNHLRRVKDNGDQELRIRSHLREHYEAVYARMGQIDMIPAFQPSEFIEILQIANRLKIYSVVGFTEQIAPYALAGLKVFEPVKKKDKVYRRSSFRFFFRRIYERDGGLWIDGSGDDTFIRIEYTGKQYSVPSYVAIGEDYRFLKPRMLLRDHEVSMILKAI